MHLPMMLTSAEIARHNIVLFVMVYTNRRTLGDIALLYTP